MKRLSNLEFPGEDAPHARTRRTELGLLLRVAVTPPPRRAAAPSLRLGKHRAVLRTAGRGRGHLLNDETRQLEVMAGLIVERRNMR